MDDKEWNTIKAILAFKKCFKKVLTTPLEGSKI